MGSLVSTEQQDSPLHFQNNILDLRINQNTVNDGESIEIAYTYYGEPKHDLDDNIDPELDILVTAVPKRAGKGEWRENAQYLTYVRRGSNQQYLEIDIDAKGEPGPWEIRIYDYGVDDYTPIHTIPITVLGEKYDIIKMQLDKYYIHEEETLMLTYELHEKVEANQVTLAYATTGTPNSIRHSGFNLESRVGTIPFKVDHDGYGPHEMRCYTSFHDTVTAPQVAQFYRTGGRNLLHVYPLFVNDEDEVLVEWDLKYEEETMVGLFHEDEKIDLNVTYLPVTDVKGSAKIKLESKGRNGRWEARIFNKNIFTVEAIRSFVVVDKSIYEKLLTDIKFSDVDVITCNNKSSIYKKRKIK